MGHKGETLVTVTIGILLLSSSLFCVVGEKPDLDATVLAALAATQGAQATATGFAASVETAVAATVEAAPELAQATAAPVTVATTASRPTPTPDPTAMPTNTPLPPPPIPAPADGDVFIRPADSMEMVYVPEGEFIMGSPDGEGSPDERPQHGVYLDAFWIDRYEVTNDQYRAFVEATGNRVPNDWQDGEIPAGKEDHPVEDVIWEHAQAYCQWAGARLPTEAEWEKAARGTDAREYPWGDEFDCHTGNFDDQQRTLVSVEPDCDGYVRSAPVGSFPAGDSPYGALDMAGNVGEWVADWYDDDYYSRSPNTDPPGPDSGEYRVVRGGSWYDFHVGARSADRRWINPGDSHDYVGLRCGVSSTSFE